MLEVVAACALPTRTRDCRQRPPLPTWRGARNAPPCRLCHRFSKDRGVLNMYASRLAMLAAVACCFCAGSTQAQMQPPAAGQPVSFDYYYQAAQPSPSDKPMQAEVQASAPSCDCQAAAACNSCCDSCGCGCGILSCWPCGCLLEDLGEACKLWEPCCEDSQWVGAGWLAQGY